MIGYYRFLIPLVVVVALAAWLGIKQLEIERLSTQIAKLEGENNNLSQKHKQCIDTNHNLKRTIEIQNESMSAFEREARRQKEVISALEHKLKQAKDNTRVRIKEVYLRPAVNTKEEAFDDIVAFMKQEAEKW